MDKQLKIYGTRKCKQCENVFINVKIKLCSRCKCVYYCSNECQAVHWKLESQGRIMKWYKDNITKIMNIVKNQKIDQGFPILVINDAAKFMNDFILETSFNFQVYTDLNEYVKMWNEILDDCECRDMINYSILDVIKYGLLKKEGPFILYVVDVRFLHIDTLSL